MKQREINKTTISTVATGLIGQFVTIFSGIIVARSLGAEGRGYLALLLLFPIIITSIGAAGLSNAITYFVVKGRLNKKILNRMLYKIIPLQLILLVFIHYVLLNIYIVEHNDIALSANLTLCLIPILLIQQYCMAFIQGVNKFGLFNLLRLLVPVLYTLLVLLIWLFDFSDLYRVVCMWVVTNILALLIIITKFIKVLRITNLTNNSELGFKEFFMFGIKGMFGALSPLESFRLDHILAGIFLSPSMLGAYVVGQAFSNIPNFVSRSASMAAFPIISKKNKSTGLKLIWQYFGVITIFNFVISILLVIALPYILPLMFGFEFKNSVILGQILIVGTTLSASRRILVEGFRGMGMPHISSFAEMTMYPWLFTGGIYLIINYHEVGLAVSVTVAFAISLIVSIICGLIVNRNIAGE